MNKEDKLLLWFEELEREDVAIVGGKSSSLGEMTSKTDVPVPYGFATTAKAYRYFVESTGLKDEMYAMLNGLDVDNPEQLHEVCTKIREAFVAKKMPEDLEKAIKDAYFELAERINKECPDLKSGELPFVAVRSGATDTDVIW